MKESDLYPPVRDWLVRHGYTIHVEVFDADIVAIKDGRILVVELKLCVNDHLKTQLQWRSMWADEVMGAVPLRPKNTRDFHYWGYGLLVVSEGKVRQAIKPRPQPWGWHKKRAYRVKCLIGRHPAMDHELAGLPSCRELKEQREKRVPT